MFPNYSMLPFSLRFLRCGLKPQTYSTQPLEANVVMIKVVPKDQTNTAIWFSICNLELLWES